MFSLNSFTSTPIFSNLCQLAKAQIWTQKQQLWLESPVSNPSPPMSLAICPKRDFSISAKESEKHRGKDGERNVVDSTKRLSGSPALAQLLTFSKSPLE